MDMDYEGAHFENRAFFMDERGNVWNGNRFIAFGAEWCERNSVVTVRLDTRKRLLTFHVTKIQSSHWDQLLATGKAVEGVCVARIENMPDTPLYAFAQDLYAGSGTQFTCFTTCLLLVQKYKY